MPTVITPNNSSAGTIFHIAQQETEIRLNAGTIDSNEYSLKNITFTITTNSNYPE